MIHDCLAGCDISSRRLDLCILTADGPRHAGFGNHAEGIAALVAALEAGGVGLVVVEPSGGCEAPLMAALWAAGRQVALVPAQRIRHFARADGQLAKTDAIDARMLAEYAARMRPDPTPPPSENLRVLRALVARRRVLVATRAAERKRSRQAALPGVQASIARLTALLDSEIAALETAIRAAIMAHRETAARAARMQTLPGIGPATSAVLLAELPELGRLQPGQAAALAGLAPHTRQSGAWRGRSFISGGRKPVRDALFMAATSAALRGSSRFARHYESLRARGKPHKLALVAVMRKMLVTLNAMLRDNRDFEA